MSSDAPLSWDVRYAGETFLFGEAPNAFLAAQAARLRRSGRALAVADGEGRNGVWLAEQGLEVWLSAAASGCRWNASTLTPGRFPRASST